MFIQRILFLGLIVIGFGTILIGRDYLASAIVVNSHLLCLTSEQFQGLSLSESHCINEDEWVTLGGESRTLAMLDHRRNYENGIIPLNAMMNDDDCASVMAEWAPRLEAYDSRSIMRNYYDTLATSRYNGDTLDLDNSCAELFPSSWYLWMQAKELEKRGDLESAVLHNTMAYLLDSDWKNEARGLNANSQAIIFRETDEPVLAQESYWRVIDTFQNGEYDSGAKYIAIAYLQLAELADRTEDRLAFLELGIVANPIEADRLTPLYVQSVVEMQGHNRLQGFAAKHATDSRILYALVRGSIDTGNAEIAHSIISMARSQDEEDAYLTSAHGLIAVAKGKPLQGVNLLNKAVDQFGETDSYNTIKILFELSRQYEELGDLTLAITTMEEALGLDQDRKWLWFRLALLYQKDGNSLQASIAIEQALLIDPQNERFLDFQRRLSQ